MAWRKKILVGSFTVWLLAACDGSPVEPSPAPQPPAALPPVTPPSIAMSGHYRGTASIGGVAGDYHAEALITVDGEVRLHIGGPAPVHSLRAGGGVPEEAFDTAEALSFVGTMTVSQGRGTGQGVVIGERCPATNPGRYCDAPASAELTVERAPSETALHGEIRVMTAAGAEVWAFDLSFWSIYYDLVPVQISGMYAERHAPFARLEMAIVVLNGAGRLFFQAASSGCTGNGGLAAHAGRFHVFDVKLLIENCAAPYTYLNGAFEGLATKSQDNYWGYDEWLVMFLSTPEGTAPRVALTMLAGPL